MTALIEWFVQRRMKLAKFIISGGTAAVTNLSVVYIFTDILHVFYLVSSGVAFAASFSVSFMLQKFWTFSNPSLEVVHKQLGIALLVASGNLVLNTFLMYCFVEYVGFHYLFAQIATSGVIALETFFVYQHVIFVARPGLPIKKETT